MKRKFLVLGVMLSCLLCFTGCGKQEQTAQNTIDTNRFSPDQFNDDSMRYVVNYFENESFEKWFLSDITPENFEKEMYLKIAPGSETDEQYEVIRKGYESWYKAVDQIGYGSLETLENDIEVSDVTYNMNNKGQLVVTGKLQGTKHKADMVIYMDNRFNVTDIGVTADKTLGEKLENAGLNTLMGMGMAFSILIIISLIICLFPILFGADRKLKSNSKKSIAENAIDNTVGQIAEKEDLSSDAV